MDDLHANEHLANDGPGRFDPVGSKPQIDKIQPTNWYSVHTVHDARHVGRGDRKE